MTIENSPASDSQSELSLIPGLYVVATPIGNLGDLSRRAANVLRAATVIAAEDTRHARRVLDRAAATGARLVSLTEHNTSARIPGLLEAAAEGAVALVSDAGTPVVADPGARVVDAFHGAGRPVFAVPGASALAAALSVSGFPADDAHFLGFLPRKPAQRQARLAVAAAAARVLVYFESPQRLGASLADVAAALGDPEVAVCRELTKLYEETVRGAASELAVRFRETRGECTVVVRVPEGFRSGNASDMQADLAMLKRSGAQRSLAAAEIAARHGVARAEAYELWATIDDWKGAV